jgi:hypothetical protein
MVMVSVPIEAVGDPNRAAEVRVDKVCASAGAKQRERESVCERERERARERDRGRERDEEKNGVR